VRSPEQVLSLYVERAKFYQGLHTAMAEIKDVYSGRTVIDLPDMDNRSKAYAPNLLAQGLDQMAGRVSGTTPMVRFAPSDPTKRTEVRRAHTAARVVDAWNQSDRLNLQMRRRARFFLGLSMSPVVLRWDATNHRPVREVRDPMETYANPEVIDGTSMPCDVIFAFKRTAGWLRSHDYGAQVAAVSGRGQDPTADTMMLCLEYIDPDGRMLLLVGGGHPYTPDVRDASIMAGGRAALMEFAASPTYCMTVSVPTRISLDRPMGQFDSMVGMYYQQAKMMALEVLAVEKGIFPDTYLESRQGEQARFIEGPYDGRSGNINIVAGGIVRDLQTQPSYVAPQTIDRLERNARVTAGIPSEFGGESPTNIRTGVRGNAVMSQVIDFPVAEAQDILAFALHDEHKAMIDLAKAYDGSASRTLYVGTGNSARAVTYVAKDVFKTAEHVVFYPVSGTDQNSLRVGIGQALGMGTMSTQTAAELDPMIADAEMEHDRIIVEGLEHALVAGIQQQAAAPPGQGGIPPLVVAKLIGLVGTDKLELAEALVKVTEDAAAQAPPPAAGPPGAPGGPPSADEASAPAALQSLAGAVPGPTGGQTSLAGLLKTLHAPSAYGAA
jgi:hypothetical protein